MYNRAKELYCDAIMFVFWFFIVYLPKKMKIEKWPKAADSPLRLFYYVLSMWWKYKKIGLELGGALVTIA